MSIQVLDEASTQVFISGSQDGTVKFWDLRTMDCVADIHAHHGSVNEIQVSNYSENLRVVTGGSDMAIRVMDPRQGFGVSREMKHHKDVITCLRLADDIAVSGSGNGNVLVHNLETGKCLYGMNITEKDAVSCLEIVAPNKLVCAELRDERAIPIVISQV